MGVTSHEGQLQLEMNGGDTLLQQTSTIPGVRRPNTTGKSRFGSSTLTSSEIATEKELWSWKSEGISEEICPLGECNNYSYLQMLFIPSDAIHTFRCYSYCSSVPYISDSGRENEDQRFSDFS